MFFLDVMPCPIPEKKGDLVSSEEPEKKSTETGESSQVASEVSSKPELREDVRHEEKEISSSKEPPVEGERDEKKGVTKLETYRETIRALCAQLLASWSSLKEVFRIPRKQIAQERRETEENLDAWNRLHGFLYFLIFISFSIFLHFFLHPPRLSILGMEKANTAFRSAFHFSMYLLDRPTRANDYRWRDHRWSAPQFNQPEPNPAERELRKQQHRKAFEARVEQEKRKEEQLRELNELNEKRALYYSGIYQNSQSFNSFCSNLCSYFSTLFSRSHFPNQNSVIFSLKYENRLKNIFIQICPSFINIVFTE